MRRLGCLFFTVTLALAAGVPAPAVAQCVQDISTTSSCNGTDVVVDELDVVSVVDPCTSYADSAQVILDAVIHNVSSPAAGRQDIGIFVAKNGRYCGVDFGIMGTATAFMTTWSRRSRPRPPTATATAIRFRISTTGIGSTPSHSPCPRTIAATSRAPPRRSSRCRPK